MLCRARRLASGAVLLLIASILPVFAEPSQVRMLALDTLTSAYAAYRSGRRTEGRAGVEKALALDPDLAYANIVRGEVALQEQDWPAAQEYFERGLVLLKQPDQPLARSTGAKISVSDVEGDARCFLGYAYVKRAQQASQRNRGDEEQRYLDLANKSLRSGLALSPGTEAKELCERLLRMFR